MKIVKKYALNICFLLMMISFSALSSSDFNYNPYPVIVVHGFGSSPGETWGLKTNKDEEEDLVISTLIDEEDTKDHDIKIGEDLINEYEGFSRYKDSSLIYDGMKYQTDRFIPYEEENSYSGFNHTFVEAYCS